MRLLGLDGLAVHAAIGIEQDKHLLLGLKPDADVSGLDLVVIDDAEAVVGANRELLTRTIMESSVGQAIVVMAKGEQEAGPAFAGLQVVRMGMVPAA